MRKVLALVLVLSICLPISAMAEGVLIDGWEAAPIEDLQSAQQSISNRISELRAASADDVERFELSGTGTAILSDVVIPFAPSRVIVTGDASVKLTGGSYDYSFDANGYNAEFFDQTGTFGLLVEASGDWAFTVEPIVGGGTLPMEGSGPYVSDFIELPAPVIVTVTGDKGTMDEILSNFIVKLHHQYKNIDAWQGDGLVNELLSGSSAPVSMDVILQPVTGRAQYCISVKCSPGVAWSISLK